MKTIMIEVEESKFEQFMSMLNLLKSDVVKRFEIQKEDASFSVKEELLEDLNLLKNGELYTTEIGDIAKYMAELKREIA